MGLKGAGRAFGEVRRNPESNFGAALRYLPA